MDGAKMLVDADAAWNDWFLIFGFSSYVIWYFINAWFIWMDVDQNHHQVAMDMFYG
jgi:hypothetical protein